MPEFMNAISVRVPWWYAILHLGKDIENRDRRWSVRGRVLIHASKWFDGREIYDDWHSILAMWRYRRGAGLPPPRLDSIFAELRESGGSIVGSVEVTDCVEESESSWFAGPWGLVLRHPIVYRKPIPWRGQLGLFKVPVNVLTQEPVIEDAPRGPN
jgi:hypothetical protein